MEEWRDVEGYEGIYQVSSEGRVRTLDRTIVFADGRTYHFKSKIITQQTDKYGYRIASFSIGGKTYKKRVHRLVAQAFIPNPNNYPIINHKNEDKTLNTIENLEWCTCAYNLSYGTNPERLRIKLTNNKYSSKEVAQIEPNGNVIKVYPSTREVERELGLAHNKVSACALGKIDKYGGFKWQYTKDMNIGGQRTANQ